jgi:hypothetical protein
MAGYQPQTEGRFGFRADYAAYAAFHEDLDEYDAFEQMISLEPQLKRGDLTFSLPLRYTLAYEDWDLDYHRVSVYPSLTYLLPGGGKALEVYGFVADIHDRDEYEVDEDALGAGGGVGYILFSSDTRTYLRISGEYQNTEYDALVSDYGAETGTDERSDNTWTASLALNYQLLEVLDVYSNYSFIDNNSNTDLYDYDRHIIEAGIAVNF